MSVRLGIARIATVIRGMGWLAAVALVVGAAAIEIHDSGRLRLSAELWLAVAVGGAGLAIAYAMAWIVDGFAADPKP